jgi:hypothetical protein
MAWGLQASCHYMNLDTFFALQKGRIQSTGPQPIARMHKHDRSTSPHLDTGEPSRRGMTVSGDPVRKWYEKLRILYE